MSFPGILGKKIQWGKVVVKIGQTRNFIRFFHLSIGWLKVCLLCCFAFEFLIKFPEQYFWMQLNSPP